MGIGTSIFLLALGAILAFAVTDAISGVDLTVVGYILMAAGALGLVFSLILSNRARRSTVVRERDVY
jgi:cytochrome b